MMKTGFDIVTLIWKILNADEFLHSLINGGIYKNRRPTGSTKEDIVVNSITIDNDQLQTGMANINFHCPNISATIEGQPSADFPDTTKLSVVTNRIIELVKDHHDQNFSCDIQSHTDFDSEETSETISNLRLIVHSINL